MSSLVELITLPTVCEPSSNGLIILNHTEIPLDPLEEEVTEEMSPTPEGELKCEFCDKAVKEEVYQFEIDNLDCYYLCTRCFDYGVRLCQYDNKFCLKDQLIQLDQGPVINKSHEEIITTYMRLPSWQKKQEYLEMCSLHSEIIVTKQSADTKASK